jgi:Cadherin-like beta sandwich domain
VQDERDAPAEGEAAHEAVAAHSCTRACPAGYSGSGETGCAPLLQRLAVSAGRLVPAFDPTVFAYRVSVPPMVQQIEVTGRSSRFHVEVDGVPLNGTWKSPELQIGETVVKVAAISMSGTRTTYCTGSA